LLSTTYPTSGGTSSISNTYYADGSLHTTTSNGATWTYQYNKRRLPETEALQYDGQDFLLEWGYDANASVSHLMYPDDTLIDFEPNALGQPTRAGDFASDVAYYPNGAMESFFYGNGISHTLTQNTRKLPSRSHDGVAMDFSYT